MSAGRKNLFPSVKGSHMPMVVYVVGFFCTEHTFSSSWIVRGCSVGSCKINSTQHEHDFSLVYISEVDKHRLEVNLISIIKHQLNFKFSSSSGEVFNILST